MLELPGNNMEWCTNQKEHKIMEFDQLVERYSKMIQGIIKSLTIYKDHDDFFQIGLIALWDAANLYDEKKGKFSTYAFSFIRGRMLMFLKQQKKHELEQSVINENHLQKLVYEEPFLEKDDLFACFAYLTEKEKRWVLLRFYHGLSNSDIAKMEKMNLKTVNSCGKRAMAKCILYPH